MTQNEIIEMARQAATGMTGFTSYTKDPTGTVLEYYTRLINLATTKEREACAKVCMETEQKFAELSNKFSSQFDAGGVIGASQCLNAIRARGEA